MSQRIPAGTLQMSDVKLPSPNQPLTVGTFAAILAAYGVATHAEKIAKWVRELERLCVEVRIYHADRDQADRDQQAGS